MKLKYISDMLNDTYLKYYNPSKHLGVDKVIVPFTGSVIFKQYLPKKYKHFRRLYKLCNI